MTKPSAGQNKVLTAREALYKLYKYAGIATHNNNPQEILDAYNDVRAALPEEEKPPTMDEIKWDNDKHYLAEARVLSVPNPHYVVGMLRPAHNHDMLTTKQIMHGEKAPYDKYILVFDEHSMFLMDTKSLAPTGRKYTLVPEE